MIENLSIYCQWRISGITFLYHDSLFVKSMPYFLPIYPFLILFAAYLITSALEACDWISGTSCTCISISFKPMEAHFRQHPTQPILGPVGCGNRGWRDSYLRHGIQFDLQSDEQPHPGLALDVSDLPQGSTLANEHWDDWLPSAVWTVTPPMAIRACSSQSR